MKLPELRSPQALSDYPRNLALMLDENGIRFGDHPMFRERRNGTELVLSWSRFRREVSALQYHLRDMGLNPGERVAFLSPNCLEMLELELAVMALGAVSIPIFAGYSAARANSLVEFCEPCLVAVSDRNQLAKLKSPGALRGIIGFEPLPQVDGIRPATFRDLRQHPQASGTISGRDTPPDQVCLMMYTSGTMGKPKCVQLTHDNILSQQAAMRTLWNLSHRDRFLSYLPWHHSFGGIFEKYAAVTNGAAFTLEHGFGKDIRILLDNWARVRPTVFFSVPRVYQEIATQVWQDPAVESLVFHPELRFIFTAAAPLPQNISELFTQHSIPVIEGWGLTETSPCCTVTDPHRPRLPGVVGQPIPGVTLRLAEDGEILVKGPNVMRGYYRNPGATRRVLSRDGWFATGDVGEFGPAGLRLISRKDRIFKLSNAKKVIPTEIENLITRDCTYLAHAYVAGSGRDYPVALLFPNRAMLSHLPEAALLKTCCEHPRTLAGLATCLRKCLERSNRTLDLKYCRLKAAMLVDYELSIEKEELTPSMKPAPGVIGRIFKANIDYLYGDPLTLDTSVYVIELERE